MLLSNLSQTNAVVFLVKNGVIVPDENITQNPKRITAFTETCRTAGRRLKHKNSEGGVILLNKIY